MGTNYPFDLELMYGVYTDCGILIQQEKITGADADHPKYKLCAEMTIGFFSLLRVSELGNLRMRDVRIPHE